MANSYLDRTPSSAGNSKTFTMSCWIKRSKLGYNYNMFYTAGLHQSTLMSQLYFTDEDKLYFGAWLANGNSDHYIHTNRVFRDVNCWYHLCVAVDTTQATASDRVKIYVNGVQETSLNTTNNYPAQNFDYAFNSTLVHNIGRRGDLASSYHEGYLSHVIMVDGTALAPTAFGETDATTGEWKIKTAPSVTWGTNGFHILKDSHSGTDQSTNSNNFTANGNLTKSEDCPSNVFCTLNPNHHIGVAPRISTLSNGNTKCADANSTWQGVVGTLGASSGKYYWEYQLVGGAYHMVGIVPDNGNFSQSGIYTIDYTGMGYSGYVDNGTIRARFNNADISGWNNAGMGNTTFSANDYINLAVDMDNKFMYIGKNGTWFKSGDPTSGASGTGGINISATFTSGVFMIPAISAYSGTTGQFNFGNGYMGTSAVSSAGTNASGIGIFEYDVPSGYTALSTKGLNE
ncbi:lectin domain containing protein [Pelagibacter phage HTVC121P]|nr:lectin domain containing protein [Pelagibacter phage HTVC121P]